ncbi:uncharacterized protein [Argopecten irradians]|uniref:uncharacterized protein n=1 Tax=Argopecten irradians TaxID=31199 RepID=UPI00371FCDFA
MVGLKYWALFALVLIGYCSADDGDDSDDGRKKRSFHKCGLLAHWDYRKSTCICDTGCGGNPWDNCHYLIPHPPVYHPLPVFRPFQPLHNLIKHVVLSPFRRHGSSSSSSSGSRSSIWHGGRSSRSAEEDEE